MTQAEQYLDYLMSCDLVTDVTLTQVTGDTCPCMTSVDANNPGYSKSWHDVNSSADECSGTGLINTSETTVNLKGNVSFEFEKIHSYLSAEIKQEIGNTDNRYLLLFGCVNTSTKAAFDFSGVNELADTFVINSISYKLRFYRSVNGIADIAVLMRIT